MLSYGTLKNVQCKFENKTNSFNYGCHVNIYQHEQIFATKMFFHISKLSVV